ncbi:regulatory protein RecX [Candidatus Saccharibacteria bacterium RAAC3_TM7_1]|nr:regulatory protein RecX [Candidatus Saccharibacteria bacterium RAAC3_TM7_1]HCZ28788.1 hypothetical protein [Candidatus Saccharibacteria bacterium]
MKITDISIQAKNKDRVNISVDGKYRFSLDVFQVGELGIKVGNDYSDEELATFETESQFGKLYGRALEYTLMRPHSAKEIRDYLWRKTRDTKRRNQKTGEIVVREGASQAITDRVYARLLEKGYIDDEKFTRFWVENRNQAKGTSRRKLTAELRAKGVAQDIIDTALENSERSDEEELQKIIAKKRNKYDDEKLMQYLARQGFRYDDIKQALTY